MGEAVPLVGRGGRGGRVGRGGGGGGVGGGVVGGVSVEGHGYVHTHQIVREG